MPGSLLTIVGWRSIAPVALLLLLAGACTPSPQRLPSGEWERTARGVHIDYLELRDAAHDPEADAAVARLEAFLDDVGPHWRVPETIRYYRFQDRERLREHTGWDTNGRALTDHDAVVSIHAADAHEVAHILTVPTGRPLRLANFWLEGIAMFYTWPEVYFPPEGVEERELPRTIGVWSGRSVHAWAQDARQDGTLPALEPLIHGNRDFDALPLDVSYPAAGSFTAYLLGPGHGDPARIAKLRAFFDEANVATSTSAVRAAFEHHLQRDLDDAEAGWHAFLDDWDETELR